MAKPKGWPKFTRCICMNGYILGKRCPICKGAKRYNYLPDRIRERMAKLGRRR